MNFKGSQIQKVRDELVHDPETGTTQIIEYRGSRAAIEGFYTSTSGCRKTIAPVAGGVYSLTLSIVGELDGPSQDETPIDSWSIDTEIAPTAVWSHPTIDTEAAGFSLGRRIYRRQLEDWASGETPEASSPAVLALPNAPAVALELSRGVENYDVAALTLRRQRRFSRLYGVPATIYDPAWIFSSIQLGNLFGLPPDVYFSLPDSVDYNTSTPVEQAAWGWRIRGQQVTFQGSAVVFNLVFVWGAHSTLLYASYA